jgi:hypothetical protein
MAANDLELAYAQARYDIEGEVQDYVRREVNCPYLHLTVNKITDELEVWYDQPGREKYLVCKKPFMGDLQLGAIISHIRQIDNSLETLPDRVARLDKGNEAITQAARDAYMDRQMPVAERIYFELYKDSTGSRGFVH